MESWHVPSLSAVSLALHVTVVVPAGNLEPDTTTLPRPSSHTMVEELMTPSKVSLAVGNGDHETLASAIPGSTFLGATGFGQVTTGASMSA